MKIHEYQAKEILKKFGVKTPAGYLAKTVDEAVEIYKKLDSEVAVVKAQIHAGGRGKGGGVKVVNSEDRLKDAASKILGMNLVTHQTGPDGQKVDKVLIEEGVDIAQELYLGMVLDRRKREYSMMVSTEGGMEIEKVASETPEKIGRITIDPIVGLLDHKARYLVDFLNIKDKKSVKQTISFMKDLYNAFVKRDCSLAEINPLVLTKDGDVIALDAKINFDDNALFRQKENINLRDLTEENSKEREAKDSDLSYIPLDGYIGCMVNGAGLAMATMDMIKHFGGDPANFLDVGGGATSEKIIKAFKIILSDEKVRGIFVNIFGGIMRCDLIAKGVVDAVKDIGLNVPLVVRLEGTNVEEGIKILKSSNLDITLADDMEDGAKKIINIIKGE